MDHDAQAEGGDRAEQEARGEERAVLVPERRDGRGARRRSERHHQDGQREHPRVEEDDGDEVAEQPPHGLDREAEIDQVPVAEEHARRHRAEGERAGHEGEGVEDGGGREEGPHAIAARAGGERGQAEEERSGERACSPAADVAPERRHVAGQGGGERRPEGDLAAPDRDALADREVDRCTEVEDGAAEEDAGARFVEAALEHSEGRDGERCEPAHGELAEDQQEAGAEVRHRETGARPGAAPAARHEHSTGG